MLFAFAALAHERQVTPGARGPNRLDVDVPLLAGSAKGLDDLRLFDQHGHEVGYLLIAAPEAEPPHVTGRIAPIAATKKTSGFELDLGRPVSIDRIRVDPATKPFLKRLTIEGSGDRAHWTVVAPDATIFDVPDQELRSHDIDILPGEYRYVRLTFDDRASAPLAGPAISARVHGPAAPPPALRVPLQFRKGASEPGKSRYRLTLPGPHLPVAAIEVEVANGNVFRDATVDEPRLVESQVAPVNLGTSKLRRTEMDGGVAAELAVKLDEPPHGADLDLVIDDGNNAPLAITAIRARMAPQPWIFFESADGSPLSARYGNPSLNAPRYDLEASRKLAATASMASAAWSGGEKAAPSQTADTLPPMTGAPLDRKAFRFSRPIPDAAPGLVLLALDADVLARSQCCATDVRIADRNGNQVPYLVERRDEPLPIDLAVPPRVHAEGSTSVYRFRMPYDSLPSGTKLVLTTTSRVFERGVTLRRAADDAHGRESTELAAETWRSTEPDLLPPALTFDAPLAGVREAEVVIDEGDNAPLPIVSARLLLPALALRFHHPGSGLTLLYGNAEAGAPRYDLALLAPRLFGESARELSLRGSTPAAAPEAGDSAKKWFWVVIVAAVLALLAMLAKLIGSRAGVPGSDSAR